MKSLTAIKANFQEVPAFIRLFLKRAILLFIFWKLLYHLILFPLRIPDHQLSTLTAISTGYIYQALFGGTITYAQDYAGSYPLIKLFLNGNRSVGIADGCNALELYVLFAGFIICLATTIKRQLQFIGVGFLVIYMINNCRCVALAWMHANGYATDFAHHYVFKAIIYAIIFYMWMRYCRKFYFDEK